MFAKIHNLMILTTCAALTVACDGVDETAQHASDEHLVQVDDSLVVPAPRHCVVELQADAAEGADATPEMACFSRFADAIFFATAEELPADATPDSYEPLPLADRPLSATFVIGVEYDAKSWSGGNGSITYTSTSTCDQKAQSVPVLSNTWQNRISSARAFSGCLHSYHYESNYFSGAAVDCGAACSYIGDPLQNRTSSIRWTK